MSTTSIPTPVFSDLADREYTGTTEDLLELSHSTLLSLSAATVSLSFSLDRLPGEKALISKDGKGAGAGDFTVWVKDGTLVVSQSDGTETEYLKVPDLVLSAATTYHLAVSFGSDGLMIWLNGELVAAEPEFKQGIETNPHALVVGGSRAWHDSQTSDAHSLFKGTIGDVRVFDSQLDQEAQMALSEAAVAGSTMAPQMSAAMEDLAPVFTQLHGASDTLLDILEDYGVNHHGHMHQPLKMITRNGGDNSIDGTAGADGIDAGGGDDKLMGKGGADVLQGGYGNDILSGGNGNDILDGGHGEDVLKGGNGNDLLISRADGREGAIAYDPDRDEGDPLNELTNGKLYPDQPVPADDVLIGGSGADIFYFQTLINAKARYIEEHTRDDGTINWHGVAGENDKLHDHWVDVLGDDVVMDFSRAEGDRLVIEGHTTEIASITYGDADADGVLDHSVIALYSDQGRNGGAHNDDLLGTITVYGDLVKLSDIEHTAAPAYGIVRTIDDLKEAIAPKETSTDTGPLAATEPLPAAADFAVAGLPAPVLALPGEHVLSGEDGDYLNAGHLSSLSLSAATVSLSFSLDRLPGEKALISKDGKGAGAGDFTVWVKDGTLVVSQSDGTETEYLKVPDLVLSAATTYHLAVSFGSDGLMIWLNGELVAAEPEFKQGIETNPHALVVGGSRAWHDSQTSDAHSLFKGTIGDVRVFGSQLDQEAQMALSEDAVAGSTMAPQMSAAMEDLAPVFTQLHGASDTLLDILEDYGVNHHGHMHQPLKMITRNGGDNSIDGTAGADGIDAGGGDDKLMGKGGADVLQGGYGNDILSGGNGNDILDGGHGEDVLKGGNGNDLLISRADGREGAIAYDPDRDEGDPLNELTNGKLYPDQPVPADDVLIGGSGADIFYFQTLINAKARYIEEHTRDDGTINWHGVAGENDKLHDHWVDVLGDDVVMDFSRAEGDRLVIEGHTTEIASITYGDADADGVLDHSVIALYSDQGRNGGAHNDDLLGTITVYGDLVKLSDIEHTAAPAYGIVRTIDDLKEAIAPKETSTDTGPLAAPDSLPKYSDLGYVSTATPVLALAGSHVFDADERAAYVFETGPSMSLGTATIAFSFVADSLSSYQTLVSRDSSGYGDGGHLSVYIDETGELIVRLQDDEKSYYFTSQNVIETGKEYDFGLSFGDEGVELWLNGARLAYDHDIIVDWADNSEALIIGASGWSNTPGKADSINSYFDGTISDVAIFDSALSGEDLFGTGARADHVYFDGNADDFHFGRSSGAVVITKGETSVTMGQKDTFASFDDMTVRAMDIQFGSRNADDLRGDDGADILIGRGGNDYIRGYDNDDLIRGGTGDDTLSGGNGKDLLLGEGGHDKLYGGDGRDELFGGVGHDTLYGESGNDWLYGGYGDDRIYGHTWNASGPGTDRAVYDGNRADYTFESTTYFDSYRGTTVTRLTVTDTASGGLDGFYEGSDQLLDIDFLVFADQTVAFGDLL